MYWNSKVFTTMRFGKFLLHERNLKALPLQRSLKQRVKPEYRKNCRHPEKINGLHETFSRKLKKKKSTNIILSVCRIVVFVGKQRPKNFCSNPWFWLISESQYRKQIGSCIVLAIKKKSAWWKNFSNLRLRQLFC